MNALVAPTLEQRAMTPADLDAVLDIEARAYSHPWSRGNFVDSLAAGHLAEVLMQHDTGTPRGGEMLGYFVALPGVDELHLLNLTVNPDHQGQGHASRLLASLQAHGRTLGLASLWLEVRASNLRAQALYHRHGFTQVGLRRGYYPAAVRREDAVLMSLPLGPAGTPPPGAPFAAGVEAQDAAPAHRSGDVD
jgi:[ribosomal protein S18]-alanine N-acetyltransferase